MRWSDIRTRVLLAAWLPVLMVGIGLSAALLLEQPDQPLFLRLRLIHLLGFDGIALSPASE